MIYSSQDKLITQNADRTIATIENIVPVTQSGSELAKNYDAVVCAKYVEILTTPNMIRRALRGWDGESTICLGISGPFAEVDGAAVMKVRDEKGEKITIMAGRAKV